MVKVMIVDDEMTVRQTIKLVLESEGYGVLEAGNADEAWQKIQKEQLDLILLDIRMPGMSAVELVKKIKADKNLKKIKIVYITAIVGAQRVAHDMPGVEATIEKPFTNEQLFSVLEKVLGK